MASASSNHDGTLVESAGISTDRSGDDATALATVLAGGSGVISVLGQGLPGEFSKMIRFGLEGNQEEASKLQESMAEGMDLIFEEGNPAGIKSVFETLQLCDVTVRLPLVEASPNLKEKITTFVKPFIKVNA